MIGKILDVKLTECRGLLLPWRAGRRKWSDGMKKPNQQKTMRFFLQYCFAVVTVFLVIYERTECARMQGACVRVTVDGSVYSGPMRSGEEQEIPIVQDGVTTECPDNPRMAGRT